MKKIIIDEEFRSLIPAMSEDSFAQLKKNIRERGCKDSLVLWYEAETDERARAIRQGFRTSSFNGARLLQAAPHKPVIRTGGNIQTIIPPTCWYAPPNGINSPSTAIPRVSEVSEELNEHIEFPREGQKCYCSECVWNRNDRPPTKMEMERIEASKRKGIYKDAPELIFDEAPPDLQQAIKFILYKNLHRLSPSPERIAFERNLDALRAEHRTRSLASRGVLSQTFNFEPSEGSPCLPWTTTRSSVPTFGTRGGCYSVRMRTQTPDDNAASKAASRSIENEKRKDGKHGKAYSPIWVAQKPPCEYTGTPVVMLGAVGVHPDDVYGQGSTRAFVRGKGEMDVTDFWAQKRLTWERFIPKASYKIILKRGDRLRDEFFEPMEQQIARWLKDYTKVKDGQRRFKHVRRERFRKMLPPWQFKNQTDEAPPMAQAYSLNELEYDFHNVFEDGAEIEQSEVEDATQGTVDEVTQPEAGKAFSEDFNFVPDLTAMLPKGYSTLSVYQCGRKKGDADIVLPELVPPRDLDPSTFPDYHHCPEFMTVQVRRYGCIEWSGLNPAKGCQGGINSRIRLGELLQATEADQKLAEQMLKGAQDYDHALHELHRHFYTGYYRYYPEPKKSSPRIFNFIRDTTEDDDTNIVDGWDAAVQNTFKHLTEDAPADGFYVMHRVNPLSEMRVYLVHPELPPSGVDAWDDEGTESPAPFGQGDVYRQIRSVVGGMRVKTRQPVTVMSNLRGIVKAGDARHIRFGWNEVQGLVYAVSS